jgi:hypothetical protein
MRARKEMARPLELMNSNATHLGARQCGGKPPHEHTGGAARAPKAETNNHAALACEMQITIL